MADEGTPHRRYDEKEVSRLLRRASELQRALPASPDPTGLTLRELEDIAAEAGIDPRLLRQAAVELERSGSPAAGLGPALAGAPLKILLERTLPFEVPDSVFATLVPVIQVAADAQGQASQVGRSLTWHSQSQSNPRGLQVLVSVRSGETLVRIEERYGGVAGALFGGMVAGGGIGAGVGLGGALGGVLGSVALAVTFPVIILVGTYAGARAIYAGIVRRRSRILDRLLHDLVELLEAAAGTPRE